MLIDIDGPPPAAPPPEEDPKSVSRERTDFCTSVSSLLAWKVHRFLICSEPGIPMGGAPLVGKPHTCEAVEWRPGEGSVLG